MKTGRVILVELLGGLFCALNVAAGLGFTIPAWNFATATFLLYMAIVR
jgi:hypothetical protein